MNIINNQELEKVTLLKKENKKDNGFVKKWIKNNRMSMIFFIIIFIIIFSSFILYKNKNKIKEFKKNLKFFNSLKMINSYEYIETSNKIKLLIVKIPKNYYSYFTINVKWGFFNEPDNLEGIIDILRHLMIFGSYNILRDNFIYKNKDYDISIKSDTHKDNFYIASKFKSNIYPELINFLKDRINYPYFYKNDLMNEFNSIFNHNNLKYIETKNKDLMILLKKIVNKDSYILKNGNLDYNKDDWYTMDVLYKNLEILNSNYISSDLMTATLVTSGDVDTNRIKRILEKIKNKNLSNNLKKENLDKKDVNNFPKKLYGNWLVLKSDDYNSCRLSLVFNLDTTKSIKNGYNNLYFFKIFINSDGKKSLKNILKIDEELIYDLFLNILSESKTEKIIQIQFYLTKKGLNDINKLLSIFYSFIDYLQKNDLNKLIKDLSFVSKYSYFHKIDIKRNFIHKYFNYNIELAENLQFYDINKIFELKTILELKDREEFINFLKNFEINNTIFIFQSNKFTNIKKDDKKRLSSNYLNIFENNKNFNIIDSDWFLDEDIFKFDFNKVPLDNKLHEDAYFEFFEIPNITLNKIIKNSLNYKKINLISNFENKLLNFEILSNNCKELNSDFEFNYMDMKLNKNNIFNYSFDIIKEYQNFLLLDKDYLAYKTCLEYEIENDEKNLIPNLIFKKDRINIYNKIYRKNFNLISSILIEIECKYIHDKIINKEIVLNSIAITLFCNYVNFIINESLENFILQGYKFKCFISGYRIVLKTIGIKNELFNFTKSIIEKIKSGYIDEKIFEYLKNKLFSELIAINDFSNNSEYLDNVFEQVFDNYILKFISESDIYYFKGMFKKISYGDFKNLFNNVLQQNYLTILFFGNFSDKEVSDKNNFFNNLSKNNQEFIKYEPINDNVYIEINNHFMIRLHSYNKFDESSIYYSYIILDKFSFFNKFIFSLINKAISDNLQYLFSKKNFSLYEIKSDLREINFQFGIMIKWIGTDFNPYYIEEYVEEALKNTYNFFKNISKNEFDNFKNWIYEKLTQYIHPKDLINDIYKNIFRNKNVYLNDTLESAKDNIIREDATHAMEKYFLQMQRRITLETNKGSIYSSILSSWYMMNGVRYKLIDVSDYLKKKISN